MSKNSLWINLANEETTFYVNDENGNIISMTLPTDRAIYLLIDNPEEMEFFMDVTPEIAYERFIKKYRDKILNE